MKSQWESIEDIERAYDLSEAGGDLHEIRKLLRAKLKDVHPDSHEGVFGSDSDENEFYRIKSAIEFVDKGLMSGLPVHNDQAHQAMMVANEFSAALVNSFTEARNQDRDLEKTRQLQEKQKQTSEELAQEVRKKFR
ncbi:MAG: hypothetical protein R3245_05235, partial [Kiloniellales bacterium]|nr:hypothetical protein [Kiloniellales bacterium]